MHTCDAPVAQPAEAFGSNPIQCGFESHSGHRAIPSDPSTRTRGRPYCGPMGRLIYSMFTSLDGYASDASGSSDWGGALDPALHDAISEQTRSVGTYLYGRRMYETMVYWETGGDDSQVSRDYARIWRAADKVVFSRTLQEATSARTRIEPEFSAELVRTLKDESSSELAIGLRILATLLGSGLTLVRSLDALYEVAPPAWKSAIPVMRERIRAGNSLASSMRESPARFPPTSIPACRRASP